MSIERIHYVLDTDIVTYHQLGRAEVTEYLLRLEAGTIATTAVTLEEQMQGRFAPIRRQREANDLTQAYSNLLLTQAYYCRVPVLPFDAAAFAVYRQLVEERVRIGTNDLRIAAIALSRRANLLTRNLQHFQRVPGLHIETF